jgi:hypothetical protein
MFQYVISLLVMFACLSLLYSLVHTIIVSARTESKSIDKVLVAPKADIELNNHSLLRMTIYLFIHFERSIINGSVVFDSVASASKAKKMEAQAIAIYLSTRVLTFVRMYMDFLSAYAEVQSGYLMTVRDKSGPNRYGKIN